MKKSIGVIGAGWYGSHIALKAAQAGNSVVLLDKGRDIFSALSGEFGIRLHEGPHYPRSKGTRESCQRGYHEFKSEYPDLVVENLYSIYARGERDAEGKPAKIDDATFRAVCHESPSCRQIDPKKFGYVEVSAAYDMHEPSIAVGKRLRETFRGYLQKAGVDIRTNYEVKDISKVDGKIRINGKLDFDAVVNATSYQAFTPSPKTLPFDMQIVYQPCLALIYEQKNSQNLPVDMPFSFIVMDGWFPCIMPFEDALDGSDLSTPRKYIVTHGSYTILGSYPTPSDANMALLSVKTKYTAFIKDFVIPNCEREMSRFWPAFKTYFEYRGWQGRVVAKIKSDREYRSAVTFETNGIINIVPGKVSNIFDAQRETELLIANNPDDIIQESGVSYVKGGELDHSLHEIVEKPKDESRNTGALQTLDNWLRNTGRAAPSRLLCRQYREAGGETPSGHSHPETLRELYKPAKL